MKMNTMKTAVAALAGGVWAAAASAVPTVTVDSFVQTPSRLVKVGFTLSEAAIVTFDVQTNGVSVGGANLQTVEGSVNAKLEAGSYALRWWPAEESWDRPADATSAWSAPRLDNVQAVFHVWKDSQPPSYLVIDLVTKAVSYYDDAGAIPGGVTADRYKTDSLVLRLCTRTESYMMGTANPWGTDHWIIGTRRPYHQVSFTNDFYIGVYEFTQGQYKNAIGSSPSCRWGSGDGRFPVDGANAALSHNKLRGSDTWPVGGHEAVTDDSILGKMRTKYGFAFDLPTEAQWEYACRGGREGRRHEEAERLGALRHARQPERVDAGLRARDKRLLRAVHERRVARGQSRRPDDGERPHRARRQLPPGHLQHDVLRAYVGRRRLERRVVRLPRRARSPADGRGLKA